MALLSIVVTERLVKLTSGSAVSVVVGVSTGVGVSVTSGVSDTSSVSGVSLTISGT